MKPVFTATIAPNHPSMVVTFPTDAEDFIIIVVVVVATFGFCYFSRRYIGLFAVVLCFVVRPDGDGHVVGGNR